MKTLLGCLLALSSLYFMPDAEAATYPAVNQQLLATVIRVSVP